MKIRVHSPGRDGSATTASEPSVSDEEGQQPQGKRRRGATTLEYLVMLSFILLGIIITVQKLGLITSGLMQNNAAATAKTNEPSSP